MSVQLVWLLLIFTICQGVPVEEDGLPPAKTERQQAAGRPEVNATSDAIPWAVSIDVGRTICSGVLISPTRVLTSAQCALDSYSRPLHFGSRLPLDGSQMRLPKFQYIHPKYEESRLENDIAILDFVHPINITDSVYPIGLPKRLNFDPLKESSEEDSHEIHDYETYEGKEAFITGWGTANNDMTNTSSEHAVSVISNAQCADSSFTGFVTDTNICSIGEDKTQNLCSGDAGSALYYYDDHNNPTLIGVGSFINPVGCEVYNSTSGFTRVSYYMDWITSDRPDMSKAPGTFISFTLLVICMFFKLL